jgi:hypothetical protein
MTGRFLALPRLRAAFGRAAALTIIVAALVGCFGAQAASAGSKTTANAERQYLIKAAFLYSFIKMTQWPFAPSDVVRLCVLGRDPFGGAWQSIEGKPVGPRKLHVETRDGGQSLDRCDVLFIGDSQQGHLAPLLAAVASRPILTVSEVTGFSRVGGILRLIEVDNRLHFKVNLAAARAAGLTISTDALKLADAFQVEAGSAQ